MSWWSSSTGLTSWLAVVGEMIPFKGGCCVAVKLADDCFGVASASGLVACCVGVLRRSKSAARDGSCATGILIADEGKLVALVVVIACGASVLGDDGPFVGAVSGDTVGGVATCFGAAELGGRREGKPKVASPSAVCGRLRI